MQTSVKIEGNVEVSLELFNETIVNNLNEDQIFDILLHGFNKRKMLRSTAFERICDDYKDEIEELIYEEIKPLQQHKDTTQGLWCTDRPDLIKDEMSLMFQIGEKDELNLINRIDGFCTSSLDPETSQKWVDVKKVLFETRKELKAIR